MKSSKFFYGWVIVAASLFIMTIAYGTYFSWPVFYVPILTEFNWGRAETAIIFSAASVIYGFCSPVSGWLFDKLGPRKLFSLAAVMLGIGAVGCYLAQTIWQFIIFYGVFVALGAIMAGYVPNLALVSNWFEKRRGLALGISQIGVRDSFILTPLIQIAIMYIGWRYSFLALAAACVVIIIPLSLLTRSRPQDMGLLPDGENTVKKAQSGTILEDDRIVDRQWAATEWTLSKALKTHRFWAIFVILLAFGFTFTSLVNHFVAMLTDWDYTALFAASLLLIYSVTSVIGRCLGFLSDMLGREVACTLGVVLMGLSLPALFITRDSSSQWLLYLFVVLAGCGNSLSAIAAAAASADMFQGKQFGVIHGAANVGYGIGAAIGTWFYGYIYDVTGAYTWAMVIVAIALAMKGSAIWVAAPRKVRRVAGFSGRSGVRLEPHNG